MTPRHNVRSHTWMVLAASCCLVGACGGYDDGTYGGAYGGPNGGSTNGTQPTTATLTGSMRGSMGSVSSFSSDSATVQVSDNATSFRFDTPSDAPQWAMANIVLTQPLTGPAWAPGTTRSADLVQLTGDPEIGGAVGCSGPHYEQWTFDRHASRVTVHVDDGSTPGARLVTFAAYWDASGDYPAQAVTGSFELPARSGP